MDFTSVINNNVVKTNSPNVSLLPFFEDLNFFKRTIERSKFKEAIEVISNSYDFIIIDCVPFLKTQNLTILRSSDSVIIPIQCDYYSLDGLHKFLKTLRYVQKELNNNLTIEGFLLTMFDRRLNLSKNVVNYVCDYFKDIVFETIIHRNSKIMQAPSYGKSVLEYDISSTGANSYLQLANEILSKNAITEELKEISIIPEEKESIFNAQKISKTNPSETENHTLLEKIIKDSKTNYENKETSLPTNFENLLNLNKSSVKKRMGSCYKNHFGNIWIYKINKSSLFKKKYLYLYFKNDIVSHYTMKWFSYSVS